jgi:hypothetical protein
MSTPRSLSWSLVFAFFFAWFFIVRAEAATPSISTGQYNTGVLYLPFSHQIAASGSPTSYTLTSGSLPPGVTLNPSFGLLRGVPTSAGNYSPAFTATNADGSSAAVVVSLKISATPGLVISEGFNYAEGTNAPESIANGGTGLPATNVDGTPSRTSTGLRGNWGTTTDVISGLTYSRGTTTLLTSGGAARVNNAGFGAGMPFVYRFMTLDPFLSERIGGTNGGNLGPDGTSVYVSFLGSTSSATAGAFRLLLRHQSGGTTLNVNNTATGWSLSYGSNTSAAPGAALTVGTSTLFVLRFDFAAGATDKVNLWIDPILGQPLGTPNAVVSGIDFPGFAAFSTQAGVAGAMTFDEVRVGTSLAAVTPHTDTAALPVITSSLNQVSTVTASFSYTITSTNNPTSFNATNLPQGLAVNSSTGLISGAPTTAGTTNTTISATNSAGTTNATLVITVDPVMPNSFYVSPTGNNNNVGTSPGQAWQTLAKVNATNFAAGKTIYFEGGKAFAGPLTISSSGTAGSPITYSSYGSGRATISSGAGAVGGLTSASKSYVTIQNLNFTGAGYTSNTATGLDFTVTSNANVNGIKIHQVNVSGYGSFGIRINIRKSGASKYGYHDFQLTHARVFDNKDTGLKSETAWSGFSTWSHGNFLIQDSWFYRNRGWATANSSGNGINLADVNGALIDRCVAFQNGLECTATGGGPVGIWSWDSNNVIIQHCEAYKNGNAGSHDGGGFDIDGGNTNCIIQYCYSHDNQGAGYLIAQFYQASRPMRNNVIRYNLSVNDATLGAGRNQGAIHVWNDYRNAASEINDTYIYGNTVYQAVGPDCFRTSDAGTTNTRVFNNIFVAANSRLTARVQQTVGITMQNNLYWGSGGAFGVNWGSTAVASLAAFQTIGQEKNGTNLLGVHADPLLLNGGNMPTFNDPTAHSSWTAYGVTASSPAREAGISLSSLIGASTGSNPAISHPGNHDFWGNVLPQGQIDIGAFEQNTPAPVILVGQSATGAAGTPFTYTLQASNSPTTWTLASGALPIGVNLNPATGAISGTPSTYGTFSPGFTATNSGGTSHAVTVTVTIANGLQSFRIAHSLPANGSQDTETPAGDGVANLLKYAFNMIGAGTGQTANLASSNTSVLSIDGFTGLPLVSLESGTGKLQLTYIRRKASTAPGVSYIVQFCGNLADASWAPNPEAAESATSIDGTFERVTVTDTVTSGPRFVRVRVTADP